MAYEKQTWVTGEVITKEKLNHMEDGIANGGGGIFLIHDSGNTLDKTWNEIYDALNAGSLPLITNSVQAIGGNIFAYVGAIGQNGDTYVISVYIPMASELVHYSTNDADGYPVFDNEQGHGEQGRQ